MIVMFSARRLKPGAWEQFRRAWDPGDAKPPGFQRAYHARNIRDEDEIISFGLFDMTEDDYRRWRAESDEQENQRVDHLSAFVRTNTCPACTRWWTPWTSRGARTTARAPLPPRAWPRTEALKLRLRVLVESHRPILLPCVHFAADGRQPDSRPHRRPGGRGAPALDGGTAGATRRRGPGATRGDSRRARPLLGPAAAPAGQPRRAGHGAGRSGPAQRSGRTRSGADSSRARPARGRTGAGPRRPARHSLKRARGSA